MRPWIRQREIDVDGGGWAVVVRPQSKKNAKKHARQCVYIEKSDAHGSGRQPTTDKRCIRLRMADTVVGRWPTYVLYVRVYLWGMTLPKKLFIVGSYPGVWPYVPKNFFCRVIPHRCIPLPRTQSSEGRWSHATGGVPGRPLRYNDDKAPKALLTVNFTSTPCKI